MKNPKTTISGIVGGAALLLPHLGVPIPPGIAETIAGLAISLVGLFAHDTPKKEKVPHTSVPVKGK